MELRVDGSHNNSHINFTNFPQTSTFKVAILTVALEVGYFFCQKYLREKNRSVSLVSTFFYRPHIMNSRLFSRFLLLTCFFANYHIAIAEQGAVGLDGITKPISDVKVSFAQPGKVKQIRVKEGAIVDAGAVLIHMEDEIELIQLKILKAKAENRMAIDLARTDLLQKQRDLQKIQAAFAKGAVTQWEVDHASLAVDSAILTLKIKEFENRQDVFKLESNVEIIKNLTLTSPTHGSVEEIKVEPGESVQALVPVIRIVNVNPLVVDLPVPVDQVKELTVGQKGIVRFLDKTELSGKISKKSTVADAAASTLNVQIEVENPQGRPAGERVTVTFSP